MDWGHNNNPIKSLMVHMELGLKRVESYTFLSYVGLGNGRSGGCVK